MGSVSITDCRDCTSAAMTTQNKQEHLGVCLQERAQDQLSKRPVQLFCRLPLERWVKKKKKKACTKDTCVPLLVL